jgi:hypothetical protein
MPIRSINDQPGPLPGERTPDAQAAWDARVASIADDLGLKLNPDSIEESTTLDIGPLRAADAFRLAVAGHVGIFARYSEGGLTRYHLEIDADGECVRATVTL